MKHGLRIASGLCVVLLLGAAGLFGTDYLLSLRSAGSADGNRQPTAARVGVASPERRRIADAVSAIGTLRALRSVEIATDVSGRVVGVGVTSGARIDEGALILQLDDRSARANLDEVEATLEEARREFRRIERLAERDAAADARLDAARASLRRAEANVTAAEAAISDRRITAPFAGTIGLIDIPVGSYVDAGEPIATLLDLSKVDVEADLSERYFDVIRPGQSVSVSVPAYPDQSFDGEVVVRAPQIDPASQTFAFRARIDNPDRLLVGGMFADARLVFGSEQGLAVADDAIISEGLTTYVFVVEDGTARRTEIEVGASLGDLTEVHDGLDASDRVVVAGWDRLSDGAPVEISGDIARGGLE